MVIKDLLNNPKLNLAAFDMVAILMSFLWCCCCNWTEIGLLWGISYPAIFSWVLNLYNFWILDGFRLITYYAYLSQDFSSFMILYGIWSEISCCCFVNWLLDQYSTLPALVRDWSLPLSTIIWLMWMQIGMDSLKMGFTNVKLWRLNLWKYM